MRRLYGYEKERHKASIVVRCGSLHNLGFSALFGICVQNDVILVAKINDFRKQGLSLRDSVTQGAITKFRPIIMTDLVMIVAVLPMALIKTTGAELHRPLAVVYIGGFFFAILLRLIVVPLLYETLGNIAEKFQKT